VYGHFGSIPLLPKCPAAEVSCCRSVRTPTSECLTTFLLTIFTKRNFVADFLEIKCTRQTAVLRFWTYDVHLRLIGKRIETFLLVLIERFSLGVITEALRANIDWKSAQPGQFDPKFQVQGVTATNHSSCQKTMINDLSCGIRMWAQVSFVLSQITRLTNFDRQTDSILTAMPCVALHAVAQQKLLQYL